MKGLYLRIAEQGQELPVLPEAIQGELPARQASTGSILPVLDADLSFPPTYLELPRRVDEGYLSVHDEHHPITELVGQVHVVGGQEDGPALAFEVESHVLYVAGR